MTWILALLRRIGRAALAHALFFVLALGWTGLLYAIYPWTTAQPGQWPGHSPMVVSSGGHGASRVILYRQLDAETQKDPTLVPWPSTPTGTSLQGQARTAWKTVDGKPWRFEVVLDDHDHVLESRYRLEGQRPVLVETRGRDVSIAFMGVALAILTLVFRKARRLAGPPRP